jgi:uncharacterized protein (DUF1810 family)
MRDRARDDPHDLQRFVSAQEGVIDAVREELRAGRKRSHWMWFVFPQMKGLGASSTAQHYGIASLEEAGPTWRTRCWAPGCANAAR